MMADPFTRASQTWAPARATHSNRTVGLEITDRPRVGIRWAVTLLSGAVVWAFIAVVCVGLTRLVG